MSVTSTGDRGVPAMNEQGVPPPPVDPARPTAGTPPPSGTPTGRLVLGGLLVLVGILWLVEATGAVELRWPVVLPAALTAVGLSLVATARRGAHGGLVAAGIVLTLLVVGSSFTAASVPLAGIGDRVERPTTLPEPGTAYELAMGTLTIDLRDVAVPPAGGAVTASVGMGELVVRLPEGVGAEVRASAGAGEVVVMGASQDGIGVSVAEQVEGRRTVVLDLAVGMGKVVVRR